MYDASDHTFVVCAYKENPYIEETVSSIMEQTVKSEVILSTSTPNNYIRQVCKRFGIRMVVNPKPHLAGDDWNFGYNSAKTKLVTMAHQDDYYHPRFLETVLAELNKRARGDELISFTDYFEIRGNDYVERSLMLNVKRIMNAPFRFAFLNSRPFIKKRILAFGDAICCPAVTLIKQNVGHSPFDTTYINSCDYKTWVDLACRPGSFIYIPNRLVGHRIYSESATSKNLGENIRKGEDLEILSTLWPMPIASLVNFVYAKSEKNNEL